MEAEALATVCSLFLPSTSPTFPRADCSVRMHFISASCSRSAVIVSAFVAAPLRTQHDECHTLTSSARNQSSDSEYAVIFPASR